MDARRFLSEAETKQVDAAVARAEARTSGEIVPVIASRSGTYDRGLYHAAIACTFVATTGLFALQCVLPLLGDRHPLDIPFLALVPLQLVALIGGYYLARQVPSVHRAFVARAEMDLAVHQAARRAFRELKLEDTKGRTGIMLYVSLFERVAVVLGDQAIAARLDQKAWDGVRDLLLEGMAGGAPVRGFVEAIAACGQVLEKEFPREPDDVNELPDHLRILA